jgi:hypothetical protein
MRCNYTGGIEVTGGNSLTIYAQSNTDEDMGKLTANGGGEYVAGIGGGLNGASVVITISGGTINANGGEYGVGIGGGYGGAGGTITIYGENTKVSAYGKDVQRVLVQEVTLIVLVIFLFFYLLDG